MSVARGRAAETPQAFGGAADRELAGEAPELQEALRPAGWNARMSGLPNSGSHERRVAWG